MNFSKRSSCKKYIPPYERLLKRIRSWRPKKLEAELKLQKLCNEGQLQPFKQPENYKLHFIHAKTDIHVLDDLIDEAKLIKHFTIDTEDDPIEHRPATLQIEFIRFNLPSIVIIIEGHYLPPSSTPLFKKIQHLCDIIFNSHNYIYSWGSAEKELAKFNYFSLFRNINIDEKNIQDEFSHGELCGLQKAIQDEFNEYLDKTATVAEWACGVDPMLSTYVPHDIVGPQRTYIIKEEEKYRTMLKCYAINDVFAVTKLIYRTQQSYLLTPPATEQEITTNEATMDDVNEEENIELAPVNNELELHAPNEPLIYDDEYYRNLYLTFIRNIEERRPINIGTNSLTTTTTNYYNANRRVLENPMFENGPSQVHVQDDQMETEGYNDYPLSEFNKLHLNDNVLEDISDNESLPDIMKLHMKPKNAINERDELEKVHVPSQNNQVRNIVYLDSNTTATRSKRSQLTEEQRKEKNRLTNRRHRANRYRHEVVRKVYQLFTDTLVKEILIAMNIYTVNINIYKHMLFIGLKNQEMVQQVDQLLHSGMFTKEHYERLTKKKKK